MPHIGEIGHRPPLLIERFNLIGFQVISDL
ncbi:Uncharacterised protein [Vibrio cholerae]|nr:Uncharacterised protein [Vibrio cholerae]